MGQVFGVDLQPILVDAWRVYSICPAISCMFFSCPTLKGIVPEQEDQAITVGLAAYTPGNQLLPLVDAMANEWLIEGGLKG